MNFTKVLTLPFFLFMIFVAIMNASGTNAFTCEEKCENFCVFDPICTSRCIDKTCHPPSISSKALINCKIACSMERCFKFKRDEELMSSCRKECSTKHCT
ncbi:protein TAP1-like [Capsicum annuum]|uniref:protein TAP1-like n=1 Tax=Capsicum annuum TaxID=4072 RepID=UPI001FB19E40|nr:protein TAP1-like [Capsicum annuum]